MTAIELEKLVLRILSGKQIIQHEDLVYELRSPNIDLRLHANFLYDQYYEENLYAESFILDQDKEELLIELEILYPNYKADIANIERKIDDLKIDYFKNFFDRTKRKKYKGYLDSSRKRYNELYSLSHSLDFLTLEYYCYNIKNEYIISNTLYYYNTDNLVFLHNIDYNLFNKITHLISMNILDISLLKEISRSDYWRNYYTINKQKLFPGDIINYSEEQKAILGVSAMYDRIYEHPECPDKDVIEDDDALDGWMLLQKKENSKQKNEKGVKNLLGDKIKNAQEVFLIAESEEQKEDILRLNSDVANMKRINKLNTVLEAQGPIADSQLPDVQEQIRNKLQSLSVQKKR